MTRDPELVRRAEEGRDAYLRRLSQMLNDCDRAEAASKTALAFFGAFTLSCVFAVIAIALLG